MSVIHALITFLMLVGLSLSLPVTAGGDAVMDLMYCSAAACAANVTRVHCEDKPIFENDSIPDCFGPPALTHVCQHDGRAFVSAPKGVCCEFEGIDYNIPAKTCSDQDPICSLPPAPASSPVTSDGVGSSEGTIVGHVFLAVICLIVVGLLISCWRRRQYSKNLPAGNLNEEVHLGGIQTTGDISENNHADEQLQQIIVPQRCHGD